MLTDKYWMRVDITPYSIASSRNSRVTTAVLSWPSTPSGANLLLRSIVTLSGGWLGQHFNYWR